MNIEGITLSLLLREEDKDLALSYYSELNPDFFSNAFKTVLKSVKDFYLDKGFIPNISELEVYRSRDKRMLSSLASIRLIDCKDVSMDLALDELSNQYAQNTALDLIDSILVKMHLMDRHELAEQVASLPLKMEEKVSSTNTEYSISDIRLFKPKEEQELERVYSGICDEWDHESGGYYLQDLVLLGGKRGSGKSIFCANIVVQQHLQGNVSVYFTIEMTAQETMERIICILAKVPFGNLKKKTTTPSEDLALAASLANLFEGGTELLESYNKNNLDIIKFQDELYKTCKEKEKGRIIIVDDRNLSVGTIDTKMSMIKSKYGDAFKVGVVDYINQVVVDDSTDMYDWKPQIVVAKTLKNIARKNNICIISPYQIDDNGIARFSKGILDSPDVAQLIKVPDKESGHIIIETTKARSASDTGVYRVSIDWKTLTIDPRPVILDEVPESKAGKPVKGLEL